MAKQPDGVPTPEKPTIYPPEEPVVPVWPEKKPEIIPEPHITPFPSPLEIPPPPESQTNYERP